MNSNRAFTLIELLVVVAIIAIITAIALPNFLEAMTRAKVTRVKADLRTIATAMASYAVDHNDVPPDYDGIGLTPGQGEWRTYQSLTTPVAYLTSVPADIFNESSGEFSPGRHTYFEYWGLNPAMFPASAVAWNARGVKWFAYSYGPNRQDDEIPLMVQEISVTRIYDPTNGTISAGDVGRSNIGVFPE